MGIPFHTQTGTIDISALKPEDLTAVKIGDGLSKINRFNGRTPEPWSVASHSVLVSLLCPPDLAAWGLLHDAHEFILGDFTSPAVEFIAGLSAPVASNIVSSAIDRAKAMVDLRIAEAWDVRRSTAPALLRADRIALLAEMFVFFGIHPQTTDAADHDDIDRAVEHIANLPAGQHWRAACDVWIFHAKQLAHWGMLRLPAGDIEPAGMSPAV